MPHDGRTRLVVLVGSEAEEQAARAAGALPARSLDDPALGPLRRVEARATAEPDEPVTAGVAAGASTWLLDTTPDRLLDRIAFSELSRFATSAAQRGLAIAFAGGLEAPDVPRLLPLKPLFLIFDGAVRDDAGRLDVGAVRELAALLAERPPTHATAGPPDRVFVRDFVEEMELGAYASERGRRQRVRFSIEAELAPKAGRRAADIYSYDRMMDAIRAIARRPPEPFVETLAEALASELLQDSRLLAVTVRVEKLDLGPGAAGVEIRRAR